jgi:hypothetical protein
MKIFRFLKNSFENPVAIVCFFTKLTFHVGLSVTHPLFCNYLPDFKKSLDNAYNSEGVTLIQFL